MMGTLLETCRGAEQGQQGWLQYHTTQYVEERATKASLFWFDAQELYQEQFWARDCDETTVCKY